MLLGLVVGGVSRTCTVGAACCRLEEKAFGPVSCTLAIDQAAATVAAAAVAVAKAGALERATAGGGEGDGTGAAGPSEASKEAKAFDVLCPITAEIMTDPVSTSDGYTFEREAISEWLRTHDTSPITGATLESKTLFPNYSLRAMILQTLFPSCSPRSKTLQQDTLESKAQPSAAAAGGLGLQSVPLRGRRAGRGGRGGRGGRDGRGAVRVANIEAAAETMRLLVATEQEAAVREVAPAMAASKPREEAVAAAMALAAAAEADAVDAAAAAKADAVERAAAKLVQKTTEADALEWATAKDGEGDSSGTAGPSEAVCCYRPGMILPPRTPPGTRPPSPQPSQPPTSPPSSPPPSPPSSTDSLAPPLPPSSPLPSPEVPDGCVCPSTNETMADHICTVDGWPFESTEGTAVLGARGVLGFLSDTDDGDAWPATRASAANPAGSTLSAHAVAFRPSHPPQHTDAITQAGLVWREAAADLGEAAAGLFVIL